MRVNKSMEMLLKDVDIQNIEPINSYPIWQKKDKNGRPYWGVGNFVSFDQCGNLEEADLSQLEWDGNEVQLSTDRRAGITGILIETIGIMKAWKETLERNYRDVPFYILMSFDNGDALVNRDDYECWVATTVRFWAPRNMNTVVDLDCLEDFDQPVMVLECNFPSL